MSDPKRRGVRDALGWWSEHPGFDVAVSVIVLVVGGLSSIWLDIAAGFDQAVRSAFYSGLAEVSGLAFAASTFICTLVYQSANYLMSNIRKAHGAAIRRNWLVIIGSQIAVAVLALLAHLVDAAWASGALVLSAASVLLIVLLAARSIWWLAKTLFIEDAAPEFERVKGYDEGLLVHKH